MSNVKALPGAFPLHEDRDFITESEWVIFKLLCRPLDTFADDDPQSLSSATGGQVTPERCDELIRTVRIHQLQGLGSWIAKLLAKAGFTDADVCQQPAAELMGKINEQAGYPICNEATVRALESLQLQWRGAGE